MGIRWLLLSALGAMLLAACSTSPTAVPDAGLTGAAASEAVESASVPAAPGPTSTLNSPVESGNAAPAPISPNAASPETASASATAIESGGRLVRLYSDPPTLDPHLTTDAGSAAIIVEVFGGLVTINPDLEVAPDLAESWDISADGRTYTFHLRGSAQFHDGKPVTAEDVLWSLERATDPKTLAPVAQQYLGDIVGVSDKLEGAAQSISGVRVVDDRTLEITIDAPKSYFLSKLTYPIAFVLDRNNVESAEENWLDRPNGTGPFRLTRYDLGRY